MVTAHSIPGITKSLRKKVIVARMYEWGSQARNYAPAPAPVSGPVAPSPPPPPPGPAVNPLAFAPSVADISYYILYMFLCIFLYNICMYINRFR